MNALVKLREEHPPHELAPAFTFEHLEAMARSMAKSGLLPGVNTPEAALALILLCQAEGLHPGAALRRYHIIEGRPSMRADAMQAEFQARGGMIRWIERTNQRCVADFSHPVHCPDPERITADFTELDAAGVTRTSSGIKKNWRQYPRQMLYARCISEGVRLVLPGVVAGIYTPEEVSDLDEPAPRRRARTVEPDAVRDEPAPAAEVVPTAESRRRWDLYLGKLLRRWAELAPLPDNPEQAVKVNESRQHLIAQGIVKDALAIGLIEREEVVGPTDKKDPRRVWEAVHRLCARDFDWVKSAADGHVKKNALPQPASEPAGLPADDLDAPDGDEDFAADEDAWEEGRQ